jgi:uncharacterized membrane protein YecN with MAPEG domain
MVVWWIWVIGLILMIGIMLCINHTSDEKEKKREYN